MDFNNKTISSISRNTNSIIIAFFIAVTPLIFISQNSCKSEFNNLFRNHQLNEITEIVPLLRKDDTIKITELDKKEYLIVHYFDGDCPICIAELLELKEFQLSICDPIAGLLFIANTNDTILLNYYIDKLNFESVVLFDYQDIFYNWNESLINRGITTFLITHSGNIIIKGNPILDSRVYSKYEELIEENRKNSVDFQL